MLCCSSLDGALFCVLFSELASLTALIRGCYGKRFDIEKGRRACVAELIRRIRVANSFELLDAVQQCADAISNMALTPDEADECLKLHGLLEGVSGMDAMAGRAVSALTQYVSTLDLLFRDDTKDAVCQGHYH